MPVDGGEHTLLITSKPVQVFDEAMQLTLLSDISERKRVLQALDLEHLLVLGSGLHPGDALFDLRRLHLDFGGFLEDGLLRGVSHLDRQIVGPRANSCPIAVIAFAPCT